MFIVSVFDVETLMIRVCQYVRELFLIMSREYQKINFYMLYLQKKGIIFIIQYNKIRVVVLLRIRKSIYILLGSSFAYWYTHPDTSHGQTCLSSNLDPCENGPFSFLSILSNIVLIRAIGNMVANNTK